MSHQEVEEWLAQPGVDAKEVHERIRMRNLENGRKMQAQQAERFKQMGVDTTKPEQVQAMMKKMYIAMMRKSLDIGNNLYMSEADFEKNFTPLRLSGTTRGSSACASAQTTIFLKALSVARRPW